MDEIEQSEREEDYHDEPDPCEPIFETPAIPTNFLPGSGQKIDCLRSRFERGEPLWHPQDQTYERFGESISKNLETIFPAQKPGLLKS